MIMNIQHQTVCLLLHSLDVLIAAFEEFVGRSRDPMFPELVANDVRLPNEAQNHIIP